MDGVALDELAERDKVERGEEHVEGAERNHRGNPATSVLEGEGLVRHAVLARLPTRHQIHVPGTEDLSER